MLFATFSISAFHTSRPWCSCSSCLLAPASATLKAPRDEPPDENEVRHQVASSMGCCMQRRLFSRPNSTMNSRAQYNVCLREFVEKRLRHFRDYLIKLDTPNQSYSLRKVLLFVASFDSKVSRFAESSISCARNTKRKDSHLIASLVLL